LNKADEDWVIAQLKVHAERDKCSYCENFLKTYMARKDMGVVVQNEYETEYNKVSYIITRDRALVILNTPEGSLDIDLKYRTVRSDKPFSIKPYTKKQWKDLQLEEQKRAKEIVKSFINEVLKVHEEKYFLEHCNVSRKEFEKALEIALRV